MDKNYLKDAIKKRKDDGMNVTIALVNPAHEKPETHKTDLAPEVKDKMAAKEDMAHEMSESPEFEAGEHEGMKELMEGKEGPEDFPMDHMSEYDKAKMMGPNHKPKSLGERAAMMEMMKKKKKV